MNEIPPASAQAFEEWLRRQGEHEVVGVRGSDNECPIACYMIEQGYPNVVVGSAQWWPERDGPNTVPSLPLPHWAMRFIDLIDGTGEIDDPVDRDVALQVLKEARFNA